MPASRSFDDWQNALRHDRIDQVQAWLGEDASIARVEFPSGDTLLTMAADQGAEHSLVALLPHSDLHHRDGTGWTPMMHALNRKSLACATALLNTGGPTTFDGEDDGGRTPLHIAAEKGLVEVVRAWMDRVPVETVAHHVQAVDHEGKNAWHEAAARGHLDLMQDLVNRVGAVGADQPDGEGWTPLLYAVLQHQRPAAHFLIPFSPIAHANHNGHTAITLAEWNGETELLPLLRETAVRQEVEALRGTLNGTIEEVAGPALNDRARARL